MNWQFFERLAESPRTTPTIHAVGLVLAIRAKRDDPKCNPSIRNLCKYAGVGMTGAVQAVRKLEELGLIRREKRRGRSTVYHLNTVRESVTPTVREPITPDESGNCSGERNSEGRTVRESVTEVFGRATTEREKQKSTSLVQDEHVSIPDSEVPY